MEALRLQEDYLERRALHTYEVRCFVLLPRCVPWCVAASVELTGEVKLFLGDFGEVVELRSSSSSAQVDFPVQARVKARRFP